MIIAATSDIHSPIHYQEFVKSLEEMKVSPDLFLLAGDMIHIGEIEEYKKISDSLSQKISCPIVACFGNTEFQELREKIRKISPKIKFLDDESILLNIKGMQIGIVGSTGSLDVPTSWQRRNIPNIRRIYVERSRTIDKLLARLISADFRILLTHYSPTYKTLEGENPLFYGSLGSLMLEKVLITRKPNLAIHGHAHKGIRLAWVDRVPVFNVAFPANKRIVVIDTEKDLKPGISRFIT